MKFTKFLSALLLSACLLLPVGCGLFSANDPARVALYTAKTTWIAGRESAIAACAKKIVAETDCKKYRDVDANYTAKHNEAVDLYLAAKPLAADMLANLQKLADESKALAAKINGGVQ